MRHVKGVLLDWRGTLALTMPESVWIARALRQVGLGAGPGDVERVKASLTAAVSRAEVQETWSKMDESAELHRRTWYRVFHASAISSELADALYEIESNPAHNPFAEDVAPTLDALKRAGIKTAVVSDIHVDLRPAFARAGLGGYIDCFVLSFEHGLQKPNPSLFLRAIEQLGVEPSEALMVGDRSRYDGAAVEAGIPTLLLPPLKAATEQRLHLVLSACGVPNGAAVTGNTWPSDRS